MRHNNPDKDQREAEKRRQNRHRRRKAEIARIKRVPLCSCRNYQLGVLQLLIEQVSHP